MNPFLAQIIMFGGNFAPRGWAFCNGQLLAISQYQALFSLLGTTYGGDGRTSFGLPELRGRAALHSGNGSAGPGLSPRPLGQRGGTQTNTLTTANMPSHNHSASLRAETAIGDSRNPRNKLLAFVNGTAEPYATPVPTAEVDMDSDSIVVGNAGGNQSVNNMQPYTAVNYIIALEGTFPSRN